MGGSAGESDTKQPEPVAAATDGPDCNPVADAAATREDVADYLVDMIRELQDMARHHGHEALGILLELAYLEARRSAPAAVRDDDREAG